METVDQKFCRLIKHKLDSNLNIVERGYSDGIPSWVGIPESTFEKIGFDKQDILEMLKKYRIFGFINDYKMFSELSSHSFSETNPLESKADDFFSNVHPSEWENLYVLSISNKKFEDIYKQLFNDYPGRIIQYNSVTGVGVLRKKVFKLKDDQPEFFLFKDLYENPNESIKRADVLKILKRDDDSTATFAINELAKKIRLRTGLTTKELVLNNGNITLSI